MEQRHPSLSKLIPFATFVLLVLASPVLGRAARVREPIMNTPAVKPGLMKVDMSHVDSLMDTSILHSPERLRRAVERSISRAQALTSRAKAAYYTTQAQTEVKSAPVYSADGAYLLNLSLGTPPQSFNGILDTGSDLVWRQSKPCIDCYPEADPYFDPSSSSTYDTVGCEDALCAALPEPFCAASACQYTYSYGDGSTTQGVLSSDTLTVGGTSAENFVFGAGNLNYGQISTLGTDGIVGMGGGPLSLSSQMSSTIEGKFSYCLVTWTDAPSQTSPLLFGASATLSGPTVVSTPFVSNPSMPTFYYLNLKGISFNGKSLPIPPGTFDLQPNGSGGVIIDSGTTITFLDDAAYSPIKKAYEAVIHLPKVDGSTLGLDLCYDNTNNASVAIPPLTFNFDGADVELPPENIFMNFQGYLCLGMMGVSASLGIDINIYGNIQQQNFQILFDKGSANQLSLKPKTC